MFTSRLLQINKDLEENCNQMKQKIVGYESRLKEDRDKIYIQKLRLDELTSILAHVPKTPEPVKIEKRMGQLLSYCNINKPLK